MAQTVGPLRLTITAERRWFFEPALVIGFLLIQLGLLGDAKCEGRWSGTIDPYERLSQWLVDHALRIECR